MGRYISTGIVYRYGIAKSSIPGIESPKVKERIIKQLFPEIYDFQESEKYLYFTLSDKISVSDLISTMEFYYRLIGLTKGEREEFEQLKELLKGKTIDEAYKHAEKTPSYLYQIDRLSNNYAYYSIPLVIDGIRKFYSVYAWIIMIDHSSAKTSTEDDLLSYDFFTDLLRYRMKPVKLADAMLIYLSA